MRSIKRIKGFTLIELVMVIVILGILAAVAIPKFIDIKEEAEDAATDGVVGSVRAGLGIYHADALIKGASDAGSWLDVLDSAGDGAAGPTNEFFASVLDYPITDSRWSKATLTYTGPNDDEYTYTPATGKFEK